MAAINANAWNNRGEMGKVAIDTFRIEVKPSGIAERRLSEDRKIWLWSGNKVKVFEKGFFKVYDISGRVVLTQVLKANEEVYMEIPSGIYFAKFICSSGVYTKRLVSIR